MHLFQEFSSYGIAGCVRNHGIDPAPCTHCSLFLTDPLRDLGWRINGKAVKATTEITARKLLAVVATVTVGTKMVLTHSHCVELFWVPRNLWLYALILVIPATAAGVVTGAVILHAVAARGKQHDL
jgi:hypothetical protein